MLPLSGVMSMNPIEMDSFGRFARDLFGLRFGGGSLEKSVFVAFVAGSAASQPLKLNGSLRDCRSTSPKKQSNAQTDAGQFKIRSGIRLTTMCG